MQRPRLSGGCADRFALGSSERGPRTEGFRFRLSDGLRSLVQAAAEELALGHGLLTVPPAVTEGLLLRAEGRPTVGRGARSGDRAPTRGQETVPQLGSAGASPSHTAPPTWKTL